MRNISHWPMERPVPEWGARSARGPRIVVGVSGRPGSVDTVRTALREALLRGCRLHLVHVRAPGDDRIAPYAVPQSRLRQTGRRTAERLLSATLAVAADLPRVTCVAEVATGLPPQVLIDRAYGADLLILGGHGGTEPCPEMTAVIGPVLRSAMLHAPCPVLVSRESLSTYLHGLCDRVVKCG